MASSADRISEIKRSAIPGRLVNGATHLGALWRDGQRCLSEWTRICPCPTPTDFCQVKLKWIKLMEEYYNGIPFGLAGHEKFYVIETMTLSQFRATGLTATVEIPDTLFSTGALIKVGTKGTTWKTILDLAELQDDESLAVAIDAVVKLQRAEFRK